MTIGEKLKICRKKAGLSQEQLADKLCVSRQAVTKWETDKGLPNIESLQAIARLFGVSVDYLLDDGKELFGETWKEDINLSDYTNDQRYHQIYDVIVKSKFPQAKSIIPLLRNKKMNKLEWCIDFLISPGVFCVADAVQDMAAYYLVELENRQLLTKVTKEFIESRELRTSFYGKKKIIGEYIFKKYRGTI